MCGIVGYCGLENAEERIIQGLEKLEYRGYDSAGISVINSNKEITTVKRVGKLKALKEALKDIPLDGKVGVGHTRWATHGVPSNVNSHPQLSQNGKFAVVHNGIIENFLDLKKKLQDQGYQFKSDTDTEVISNLFEFYQDDDFLATALKVSRALEGAYAIGVICQDHPDQLIAIRHESPLVIGVENNGYIIASDIPALLNYTREVISLKNGELALVEKDSIHFYDFEGHTLKKETEHIDIDIEAASKDGYDHFMLKEIYEQPDVIKKSLDNKFPHGKLNLTDQSFSKEELLSIETIYFTACGTAYHAAEVGMRAMEKLLHKKCQSEIASELKYYQPFIDEKTLLIVVSQSGETGDTLAAMREAKEKGAKILAVTNVVGSSIAREADKVIYCNAGPEISVASTKAYTTQLISLYALAIDFAQKLNCISDQDVEKYIKELYTLPSKVQELLDHREKYKDLAEKIKGAKSIFYLGRGIDYLSAKEGALKLKEISYINAVAFQSGELKHGSIALLEDGLPVVCIISQENLVDKSISNVKEVKARGAYALAIAQKNFKNVQEVSDDTIFIPETLDIFTPVLSVLPQQLLAYETSLALGNDVDKPRNLAKSVTVE